MAETAERGPIVIKMGNTAVIQVRTADDGTRSHHPVGGEPNRVSAFTWLPHKSLMTALIEITHEKGGFWVHHSAPVKNEAGDIIGVVPPAWVECADPGMAAALSSHYGCPIGRPKDVKFMEHHS